MPFDDILASWLARSALASLAILLVGSGAVLVWRQPARRVRIIELALAGCLLAPWLGMIPGYPQLAVARRTAATVSESDVPTRRATVASAEKTVIELSHPGPATSRPVQPQQATQEPARTQQALSHQATLPTTVPGRTDHEQAATEPAPLPPPARVEPPVAVAEANAAKTIDTKTVAAPVQPFKIRRWIAGAYLAGVALAAGWWLVGLVGLVRILRASLPAPPRCRELLREISGGRGEPVRLLVSRRLNQPFASAWGRPVIVLPESLCGDERALRWCLAHEWAHVAGHDFRAWLLAGLARVLFFYQPLVWWLRRQLRLCQDFVADSQAARQATDVEDYAEFLTALAAVGRLRPAAAIGLSMTSCKSELYRRVIMVLKNQPLESRAPRLWTVSATLFSLVLAALVATVTLVPRAVAEEKPAAGAAVAKAEKDPASSGVTNDRNDAPEAQHTNNRPGKTPAASSETKEPPKKRSVDLGGGVKLQMTLIPAGEFLMGSGESAEAGKAFFSKNYHEHFYWTWTGGEFSDELPQHRVRITKPFYLGTYHVTRGQFRRFVAETNFKTDIEKHEKRYVEGWNPEIKDFDWSEKYSWRNAGFEQTDEHPVVNVSWNDAVAFCEWLSKKEGKTYRLPTEAEWEYACRAGTTTRYYSGDDPETLAQVGNVPDAALRAQVPDQKETIKANDGHAFTAPVGRFKPNAFGLYDMHGNAEQWCADWFGNYAKSPIDDPTGPDSGTCRVLRGGSWYFWPSSCRSAARDIAQPENALYEMGFRVACADLSETKAALEKPAAEPPAEPEKLAADEAPTPEPKKITAEPTKTTADLGGGVKLEMTLIPAGEFMMGSGESTKVTAYYFNKYYGTDSPRADQFGTDSLQADDFKNEHPQHRVRITKPFYLGTYHVTRGQFRQFVKDTGYKTDAEKGDKPGAWGFSPENKPYGDNKDLSWRKLGFEQTDEHPVVCVSWNDAVAFCQWLSKKDGKTYRLPTEAEWEYACRAGTTTRYYSGDDPESLATVANVADATLRAKFPDWKRTIKASDGYLFTAPVGRFKPNAFGLYDMHGNAWQLCADRYRGDDYWTAPVDDPKGPDIGHGHIARGGSWFHGPCDARSAKRGVSFSDDYRADYTGFRVARNQ